MVSLAVHVHTTIKHDTSIVLGPLGGNSKNATIIDEKKCLQSSGATANVAANIDCTGEQRSNMLGRLCVLPKRMGWMALYYAGKGCSFSDRFRFLPGQHTVLVAQQ